MNYFRLFAASLSILLLIGTASSRADFKLEIGLNGAYTNNLLSDSTKVSDRYSTSSAIVRYYPLNWLEFNLTGEHTYYDRILGLTNRLGRVGVSAIPLRETSRFSLYLSASFDGRRYRSKFRGITTSGISFDNDNLDSRISFGYRIKPYLQARCGVNIQSTAYLSTENGDKKSIEFFSGVNLSFWGKNSLDLEAGIGATDYRDSDTSKLQHGDPYPIFLDRYADASLRAQTLRSVYFSPRYSRPLGSLTGLNITFVYRSFQNNDGIVFGSSVGLLSPWTSIWEGKSITLGVKTYLVPAVITSTGVGYWKKTYLNALESVGPNAVWPTARADEQERVYLEVTRPISVGSGGTLQPSVVVDYVHNKSTNAFFKYSGVSIQTGIIYRF